MNRMNRLLNTLERKMGRFYIRGLMQYIVFGMLGVYLLEWLPTGNVSAYDLLVFDRALVLKGQIWRLFTFIFLPPDSNIIFIIFALMFYYFIGTALENQWGSRRFNLYYLIGIICCDIGGFILGFNNNTYLNMSLFLAFAFLYPDMQINLFFFLPVKVKYIAWFDAALLLYYLIIYSWPVKACILFSMVPLVIFFGDTLAFKARQLIRKIRFRLGR